jgi:hypothetical protein
VPPLLDFTIWRDGDFSIGVTPVGLALLGVFAIVIVVIALALSGKKRPD